MKQISLFLMLFAINFAGTTFGQTTEKQKLAVYVGGNGDNAVKKVVGSKLTAAITNNSNYIAVERTQEFLSQLRNELFYQRTGNVDDKQIADFGRQMGVNAVCIAEVTGDVFGSTFVSARILDVTTGLVTAAAEIHGSFSDMSGTVSSSETLARDLCNTIGYELGDCTKLAVYVGGDGSDAIKKVIGSRLVSSIIGNGYYSAVERTNAFLAEVGKEYDYQKTRNVNDSELTTLGKQFGVKVVCAAEITEGFGEYFVSVRLINVSNGQILYTAESNKKLEKYYDTNSRKDKTAMDALYVLSDDVSTKLMKQIVTCTKAGKKARYSDKCCDGSGKINGECIDAISQINKETGWKLTDIKVIADASFNDKNSYQNLINNGYHLASNSELSKINQKVINSRWNCGNYILTSNSYTCCGRRRCCNYTDILSICNMWLWSIEVTCFSFGSNTTTTREVTSKCYNYKDFPEKFGPDDCKRKKEFSMIFLK